uniref:Urocanate hydratase n=1 Tax=Panagrolaimus sp. PS1159 TaxID=55785 RepID=A0AC35GUU8_9BILA
MDIHHLINEDLFEPLVEFPHEQRKLDVPHAPKRAVPLDNDGKKLAVRNILRYVPSKHHGVLAKEFANELMTFGHIYAFRFMPKFNLHAIPIDQIPGNSQQAAAIILMILNNLDPAVAQFPQELVTYGGNGQVFSNWLQFRLVIKYLAEMTEEQTLSLYSGHPLGLFPSHENAPRVVITNGMMIPNYSTKEYYDKFFALGVTQYGQMTAGSYCYIGPQGIVHGTTITVMNAGRKYLSTDSLAGKVFLTSGLGGMSGAQAKAAVISGCVGVIAEISEKALLKRHHQGWLDIYSDNLDTVISHIKEYRQNKKAVSIGYLGNVVDLWEKLAEENELLVELGSDQTSCHNPYNGGYYPVGLTFDEANKMMSEDPKGFEKHVKESLRRQIKAIDTLAAKGMHFWDYGNAFLLECHRAGADVLAKDAKDDKSFKYPSYMQDIMGDIFSLGFGPFRWVCTSGLEEDLQITDKIAAEVISKLSKQNDVSNATRQQYDDNRHWIEKAEEHKLVVGSQARILYSDQEGRIEIALAFNNAVREKRLKAPIVISRDHHDVSGTDSPFRETSNIIDGSAYTADMAVQNAIGDAFRGATWISLHNGGGVGWGDVINGGFGMVLDGKEKTDWRAGLMLNWDVSNGVARRSWSGNDNGYETIKRTMEKVPGLKVTLPNKVEDNILDKAFN